jgi:hypothetical protein
MEKHLTAENFSNGTGLIPYTDAIVSVIPDFFGLSIFLFFILGTLILYVSELKTTNAKKFWESMTAMSLFCLIATLFVSIANVPNLIYARPYWIFLYILTTAISYKSIESYD